MDFLNEDFARCESFCKIHLTLRFYCSSQEVTVSEEDIQSSTNSENLVPFMKAHLLRWCRYVRIRSSEREPFTQVLQKLRRDLKKTISEIEGQLEVLKDDITDL